MARTAKKARKAPKQAPAINESALTKGELRKLNALRKSVGDTIAEQTFMNWLRRMPRAGAAAPRDRNAELIAETLGNLVRNDGLRIPRGGYIVRRGRGRVIVTRAKE